MTKRIEIKYKDAKSVERVKNTSRKTKKQKLISQNVLKNVKEKQRGNLTDMVELGPNI